MFIECIIVYGLLSYILSQVIFEVWIHGDVASKILCGFGAFTGNDSI